MLIFNQGTMLIRFIMAKANKHRELHHVSRNALSGWFCGYLYNASS